jgi:hypothetical protein
LSTITVAMVMALRRDRARPQQSALPGERTH